MARAAVLGKLFKGFGEVGKKSGKALKGLAKDFAIAGGMASMFSKDEQENFKKQSKSKGKKGKGGRNEPSMPDPNALSGVFKTVEVKAEKVMPKLGPHEGQYAAHLNNIIEHVASVEGEVSTQNNLIATLEKAIYAKIDQDRREILRQKRLADEESIERKKFGSGLFNSLKDMKGRAQESVIGKLLGAAGAAIAGVGMGIADLFNDGEGFLSNAMETIDNTIESFTRAVVAAPALANIVNTADAKARNQAQLKETKQKIQEKKAAKQGKGVAPKVGPKIEAPKVGPKAPSGQSSILKSVGSAIKSNPKAKSALQMINKAYNGVRNLANTGKEYIKRITDFVKKSFPKAFANKLARLLKKTPVVKITMAFALFEAALAAGQRWFLGTMSEGEFQTEIKRIVNEFIMMLGPAWALTIIGGLAGSVVPIVGNVAGAFAGFVIGVFWGDDIYKVLGLNIIVDAFVDWIIFGKDDAFASMWPKIVKHGKEQFKQLIVEPVQNAVDYVTGVDKIASEDVVAEKYGQTEDKIEIISQAASGLGTDEDSILYAVSHIKTGEEWEAFKTKYEDQTDRNFVEEMKSEGVYDQIHQQVYKQMADYSKIVKMEKMYLGGTDDREEVVKQIIQQKASKVKLPENYKETEMFQMFKDEEIAKQKENYIEQFVAAGGKREDAERNAELPALGITFAQSAEQNATQRFREEQVVKSQIMNMSEEDQAYIINKTQYIDLHDPLFQTMFHRNATSMGIFDGDKRTTIKKVEAITRIQYHRKVMDGEIEVEVKKSSGAEGDIINFIKKKEGFSPTAFWDHKQWSIGYGTKSSEGETITEAEAERRLISNVNSYRAKVLQFAEKNNYDWNDKQVDALTSFTYNLGTGALDQVTGLDKGQRRTNEEIAHYMLKYNKASGRVNRGLVERRIQEVAIFKQEPSMNMNVTPSAPAPKSTTPSIPNIATIDRSKDQAANIVPVVMAVPQQQQQPSLTGTGKSEVDSSRPSYSTRDGFNNQRLAYT